LDEKRRTVLEKLRERKADSDGSSHWGGGWWNCFRHFIWSLPLRVKQFLEFGY
jgi:hypothetical protein